MNTRILCLTSLAAFLFMLSSLPSSTFAKEQENSVWHDSARRVLELADAMDSRSSLSSHSKEEDRQSLLRRRTDLVKHLEKTEQLLAEARHELTKTSARRAELAKKYQQEMADMKTVEGIFRTAVKQAVSALELSPVTAQYPQRLENLRNQEQSGDFMTMEEVRNFTTILLEDIQLTAEFEQKKTGVIGLDGTEGQQETIRGGGFFLGYLEKDRGVYALPRANLPPASIRASKAGNDSLTTWLSGRSDSIPLDITRGTAFQAIQEEQGLEEWVEAGGVLLYPIILAGLLGIAVALFKGMQLLAVRRLSPKQRTYLYAQLEQGEEISSELKGKRFCPAARVILACLKFKQNGLDAIDSAMEEAIMAEQAKLERFLSTVGVLATISPLLGLLGTVTGMIDTFQAITVYGTGDPRMMSTGISEALITTQAGLGVALPLLLLHHVLKRRVAAVVENMEESGSGVTAQITAR